MTDEPLPPWAVKKSSGNYLEEGAQLCTRDGRMTGNACVVSTSYHNKLGQNVARILTDAGSGAVLTLSELMELFHPPRLVMDPRSAPGTKTHKGE